MFRIDGTPIGRDHRPFVIAEAGVNFMGSVELAKSFIEAAAEAGADAIKFQTHIPGAEMVQSSMEELGFADLFERMKTYELTEEDHRELQAHCRTHDISFLSTPFSAEAVSLLDGVDVPAVKIGSGEFTNRHLVRTAADTGRPLILSTGMSPMEDVEETVQFVRDHAERFALLYCVSAYPTASEDFNLGVIERMRRSFDVPVGFSDHSTDIRASVVAMGYGADIIEKHFTLDRNLPGGDQDVSIEPDELSELVSYADLVYEAAGSDKPVLPEEQELKSWAFHSVVASKPIDEGAPLTESNVTTKRPGVGIPASDYYEVLGCTVERSIEADEIIRYDDLHVDR